MTLDEFLAHNAAIAPQSAQLDVRGFAYLFVRRWQRGFLGKTSDVLTLVYMEAAPTGQGTFKALVAHLREQRPQLILLIESVTSPRFQDGLRRLGFVEFTSWPGPSFYLPALS